MFRAELLKLSTTMGAKVALFVGIGGLLLTQLTFVTLFPALASGAIGPGPEALGGDLPSLDFSAVADQLAVLSPLGASGTGSIGIAVVSITLLGVLAGTSDYRYGGIVATALAEPRRGRILLAKTAATGVTGLLSGAAFALVSIAALLATLALVGAPLAVGPLALLGIFVRGSVAIACLALLGLAVGILTRSQLAGVLTMFAILVIEPIIQGIAQLVFGSVPVWAQFLPVSLAQAAIGTQVQTLPALVAVAGLAALTATALVLAAGALRRRDV